MNEYNKQLFHYLMNLDTFSRISINTDIHLSKTGYFVPTAGKLSSIIGAQSISNYWNEYTPDKLARDVKEFAANFINLLYTMCHYANHHPEHKLEVANKIKFIKKQYYYAYGNHERGLTCLLNTNVVIYDALFKSFQYIMDNLALLKDIIKLWQLGKLTQEYSFNDNDWELYIYNSTQLQYETIGFYKYYVKYYSSFMFNQFMNTVGIYNWFDKIYTTNNTHLYLGAMPMKLSIMGLETRNDATLLKNLSIHSVLSVVECYENRSNGILYSPILPEEFQSHNIKFLQIPIPDFCEVSIDKINTCVAYIYWNISNGRNVYISCRIGKCRSCLILMAYLIKYHGFTSENVYGYIQSIRPQVQNKHHKTLQLYEQSLI